MPIKIRHHQGFISKYNVKINTDLREWFSHAVSIKENILSLLPRSISFNFLGVSVDGEYA